jgi:hypothetical protein
MTGPKHYREAETLLDLADHEPDGSNLTATLLAAAQTHAILAQVAATVSGQVDRYWGEESTESRDWSGVVA